MKKLNTFFNRAARATQKFVHEYPIKVYSLTYFTGDLQSMAFAVAVKNPVLFTAGAIGGVANSIKILWGKGGVWDGDKIPQPSWRDVGETLRGMGRNVHQLMTEDYWTDLCTELLFADWPKAKDRFLNAYKVRENPFDAGLILYSVVGGVYAIDGLNFLAGRSGPDAAMVTSGLCLSLASSAIFVTDRNDLAGPAFSSATLSFGVASLLTAIGSAAGATDLVAPTISTALAFGLTGMYLFGNTLVGKVKTEHQSDRHKPAGPNP